MYILILRNGAVSKSVGACPACSRGMNDAGPEARAGDKELAPVESMAGSMIRRSLPGAAIGLAGGGSWWWVVVPGWL